MNIKSITVKNFRGFDSKTFEFDSKMNVVLGDNTTGKTTLLHAVQIALGAYLQAMSLIPSGKAYGRNFQVKDQVKRYSEANKGFQLEKEKPYLETIADFINITYDLKTQAYKECKQGISWIRNSNNISQKSAGELITAVNEMEECRRNADKTGTNSVLPLMLSFGAKRLDKNYRSAEKTKARESREEKAYKSVLNEEVDFKAAFDWIYRYDKNLEKDKEFKGTKEAFFKALKDAIPALKEIEIDTKNVELDAYIQMTKDPEPDWYTYEMMSDGFKAMINIVAEIAYRCIELNGFLGEEAVIKTPGIVLIDELDLYLHPHWQQHVLADLQKAFPKFQFIVTTHSPFIVQSVETSNVISLDTNYVGLASPSNRGIEEIAVAEMGMKDLLRSEKYRKKYELAHKYFELVKAGNTNPEVIEDVRNQLELLEREARLFHDPGFEALLDMKRGNI